MFASPFAPKVPPEQELWSFTITGSVRTGVVVDSDGDMYVAATASSEDAFPYIYRVDISTDAPAYIWLESLDTTGSAIFGTPILGYEGGRRALYLAATTGGTATNSDNTYIYAFATTPLDQSTADGKRTDLLWTFPSSVSASYSNIGEIRGAGALHHNGILMFGTKARGDTNYGGSNGIIAVKEGVLQWKFSTGDYPVSTSLIVDGPASPEDDEECCDNVYFVAGSSGSNEVYLYAVNVYSGDAEWRQALIPSGEDTNTEGPTELAAPSFGSFDDIIVGLGSHIYSINKRDGSENWQSKISSGTGEFAAAAAVYRNTYFIGNTAGRFFRLKPNDENSELSSFSQIAGSFGIIKSSPLIYGHAEVMQIDQNGRAEGWKLNAKKRIWVYDYKTVIADGRQPAITHDGKILLGISNAVVAIGGDGGCLAGYFTREVEGTYYDFGDNKSTTLLSAGGFCDICGRGNFSSRVGAESCERCEAGKWADEEGATFCYDCQVLDWCPGGNRCQEDDGLEIREGTMCNFCINGYYLLFTDCMKCPKTSFVYTLALIGGLILFMFIYMHFTRGTKFAYEVSKDDVIAIYVNNGSRCEKCRAALTCGISGAKSTRIERKVTRVIDDYSIEVAGNFSNKFKIKNVPFWLIKCRVYGDEIRKQGSGRVTIGTATDMLDDEAKIKLKALTGKSPGFEDTEEKGGLRRLIQVRNNI